MSPALLQGPLALAREVTSGCVPPPDSPAARGKAPERAQGCGAERWSWLLSGSSAASIAAPPRGSKRGGGRCKEP